MFVVPADSYYDTFCRSTMLAEMKYSDGIQRDIEGARYNWRSARG